MKRIINVIYVLTVVVLSLLFTYPSNTYALTEETSYLDVNDTKNIEVGNLFFNDIAFKDYSQTSTQAFGLAGLVKNGSNNEINYTLTVYYYDYEYNLLAEGHNSLTALSGSNSFNQMSNLSLLNGHNVSEIRYYSMKIETTDDLDSSVSHVNGLVPSKNSMYRSYDYVIDKYDINIIVNEDNTFDVTETITAYFNVSKHGIFRTIPLKNTVTRLDGTTSKNRARVTDVSVDNQYQISRENGNFKIKIGSANSIITGEQSYVIKYKYHLGKDSIKNYDELYYNIIGSEWDTVIGNVTFSITMPKEFDSSKLGFSSGTKGSTNNSNVNYRVVGNTITGSYNAILNANEALTVRCELPEGYFVSEPLTLSLINYVSYIMPVLFVLISGFLWHKFGRDDQVIETVEFYPPQGFNSLEVGFLYKGTANNKDVTSLLIYLANQGYIKISETEEKSLFSKNKGFRITKLKEYDGTDVNEQLFLKGLFSKKGTVDFSKVKDIQKQAKQNGEKISFFEAASRYSQSTNDSLESVTASDLYDNFYTTMNEILANIKSKEHKGKYFEKSASNKSIFIVLMIIITFCIITIPPVTTYGDASSLLHALLFPGLGFTMMFGMLLSGPSIREKLFGLIWGLLFGGFPFASIVMPTLLQDTPYLIGYIIGLVCVFCMEACLTYLSKRTPYGNELFGKIKGFKTFLETAEKNQLEAMVMQHPTYFYNILPYTYVLGVSDKWIKKFESISMQAPSWYDSPNAFDVVSFGSFMNDTMSSAQSSMSSSPSSDSSGGGSSGGGSGGGGGGSW